MAFSISRVGQYETHLHVFLLMSRTPKTAQTKPVHFTKRVRILPIVLDHVDIVGRSEQTSE